MINISNVVQDQNPPIVSHKGSTPKIVVRKIQPISPELPTYQEQRPQVERSLRQTTQMAASIVLTSPFLFPLLIDGYDRHGTRLLQNPNGQSIDLEI